MNETPGRDPLPPGTSVTFTGHPRPARGKAFPAARAITPGPFGPVSGHDDAGPNPPPSWAPASAAPARRGPGSPALTAPRSPASGPAAA
jgi:hypothetical protein